MMALIRMMTAIHLDVECAIAVEPDGNVEERYRTEQRPPKQCVMMVQRCLHGETHGPFDVPSAKRLRGAFYGCHVAGGAGGIM